MSDASLRTLQPRPEREGVPSSPPTAVFEVEGLTVSYDGHAAVRNVTFEVQERSVTAFIGTSS